MFSRIVGDGVCRSTRRAARLFAFGSISLLWAVSTGATPRHASSRLHLQLEDSFGSADTAPDEPASPLSFLAPGDIGFVGPSGSGTATTPTTSKPESKLWFNDGIWWAS